MVTLQEAGGFELLRDAFKNWTAKEEIACRVLGGADTAMLSWPFTSVGLDTSLTRRILGVEKKAQFGNAADAKNTQYMELGSSRQSSFG